MWCSQCKQVLQKGNFNAPEWAKWSTAAEKTAKCKQCECRSAEQVCGKSDGQDTVWKQWAAESAAESAARRKCLG